MKKIELILIGGGSSAIEIIDLIRDINEKDKNKKIQIIGILDDNKKIKNKKINGVKVLGQIKDIKFFKKEKLFINIMDKSNRIKRFNIIKKLIKKKNRFISLIHPNSLIGKKSKIGFGVSVFPGCSIYSYSSIGNFCNLMPNASVASFSKIETNCFLGKNTFIGSKSKIKKNCYISNNSTILDKIYINEGNRILPHSLVNHDFKNKKMLIGGSPIAEILEEKI